MPYNDFESGKYDVTNYILMDSVIQGWISKNSTLASFEIILFTNGQFWKPTSLVWTFLYVFRNGSTYRVKARFCTMFLWILFACWKRSVCRFDIKLYHFFLPPGFAECSILAYSCVLSLQCWWMPKCMRPIVVRETFYAAQGLPLDTLR